MAIVIATGVYGMRRVAHLGGQVQTLQQQQAPLTAAMQLLQKERDAASSNLNSLRQENDRLRLDNKELAKLRGEVARLRAEAGGPARLTAGAVERTDPFTQSVEGMLARAVELNRYLQQMSDKRIPKLQLLTENDWLSAAKVARFDTEADIRKALGKLLA